MIERVSKNLHSFYQIRSYNLHKFRHKIFIKNDLGPFELKTATSLDEIKEAFALRYSVFHKNTDMNQGRTATWGLDIDEYDYDCDHIIIKDKRSEKIICTFRIRCSEFTNKFYFSKEFSMNSILQQPGIKLEIGRACLHEDYRQGVVMSLFWKGIADYVAASDAQTILGCATIFSDDPRDAALLLHLFEEQGRMNPGFRSVPTPAHTMPLLGFFSEELRGPLTETQRAAAKDLLPLLSQSILNTGAYIGGEPAWDPYFKCLDFLTILHRKDLNKSLWQTQFHRNFAS